jgi:hypothetical protein
MSRDTKIGLTEAAVEPVFEDDDVIVSGVGPSHLNGHVVCLRPENNRLGFTFLAAVRIFYGHALRAVF